jgi:hypothetical protein
MQEDSVQERSELHLYSFFNPGTRLGWMILPRPGRFIPKKNAESTVQKVWCVSGGKVLVREMSPTVGSEPRTVKPEANHYNYCINSADSGGVQAVKNIFHIRFRMAPTEGQPMDSQSKQRSEHPPEPLHQHGLDLYGRPRSTAIAFSSWERTPGSHTTQGASCTQDAVTPSSAPTAAAPVQCDSHVSGAVAENDGTPW